MANFDRKEYSVYSRRYDIHGVIHDYGFVTKLKFCYLGKELEIGVKRPFPDSPEDAYRELGEQIINSYVENLCSGKSKDRRLMLHYWHLEELKDRETEDKFLVARGVVTGHVKFTDSMDIYTAPVEQVRVNEEKGEVEIYTKGGRYYCPLAYCNFRKQDKAPSLLPRYEMLKCKYKGKYDEVAIEPGKVLLVLSNFASYYFHSLYYIPEGKTERADYCAGPNVGNYQDTYEIEADEEPINLRYFPHFQNIELYMQYTDGRPLYIENIGDITLYVKASCGTIRLDPGERKEVLKENTEDNPPILPQGDLYLAGIIE